MSGEEVESPICLLKQPVLQTGLTYRQLAPTHIMSKKGIEPLTSLLRLSGLQPETTYQQLPLAHNEWRGS